MIKIIHSFENIDQRKLMDLYRESNEENIAFFYPQMQDKREALAKVERDYLSYIKNAFFSSEGNAYVIYESENIWLSALRLYRLQEGFYYIEALETHPQYRRKGYGARLLAGLVDMLKEQGSFRLCDCVGKKNFASLSVHKRCGFEITDEVGHDYLNDETDDRCYSLQYVYQRSKVLY